MCGRYSSKSKADELAREFELNETPRNITPRFNVAPTQSVPVVFIMANGRELGFLRWGLVPSWAKDPDVGNLMINARAESVAEKPAYRSAFKKQRCLVVASGFYEWRAEETGKQPYHFQLTSGGPFGFAGLFEHWQMGDQVIDSCTVITTEANELVRPVHERMPVIIPRENYAKWLDPAEEDPVRLKALLLPFDADQMTAWPVSRVVNSPTHDSPECVEPLV
jgi:putative SOS response-associated peptidase YedK